MIKELKKREDFWRNKRVFITGHTGFKGSWLVLILNLLKAKVTGFSLRPKKISLFNQAKCSKLLFKNYYADINNLKNIKKRIKSSKAQIVFHLAAQPLVSESYEYPLKTFQTNIIGTANLIEAVKDSKTVKTVIIVTTDKVYKIKNNYKSFSENDELGGIDPYSASKASSEIIVKSLYESFFKHKKKIKIATVRSGNVLGGGDYSKNRIIPDILESLNKKKNLIIRNPNHIRPWQHVIEPLDGYLILAEKLFGNKILRNYESWNFGPKNNSFINVYKLLIKINKIQKFKKIIFKKNNFKETTTLKLNSRKSTRYLKWKQKWNIDTTINKILDWNNDFIKRKNIRKTCENQIRSYLRS